MSIIDDFVQGLKDRMTNPIFVPFMFAWSSWNFSVLLITFSDLAPSEKIRQIDKVLCWTWYWHAFHWFIAPALITLVFVAGFPWLKALVERWLHLAEIWATNKIVEDSGKPHFPGTERVRMERDMASLRQARDDAVDELAGERTRLGQKNDTLRAEKDRLETEVRILSSKVNEQGAHRFHWRSPDGPPRHDEYGMELLGPTAARSTKLSMWLEPFWTEIPVGLQLTRLDRYVPHVADLPFLYPQQMAALKGGISGDSLLMLAVIRNESNPARLAQLLADAQMDLQTVHQPLLDLNLILVWNDGSWRQTVQGELLVSAVVTMLLRTGVPA